MRTTRRRLHTGLIALPLTLAAVACGSDGERGSGPGSTTTTAADPSNPVLDGLDPRSYFEDYTAGADVDTAAAPAAEAVSDDVASEPLPPGDIEPPVVEPPTVVDDNTFEDPGDNPFTATADDPLSTFGLDVDTGSLTVAERLLREGFLPPTDAVRIEEFLNAFEYGLAPPTDAALAVHVDGVEAPFQDGADVVRVGVTTRAVDPADRAPAAITFVVDVSGSMDIRERLGLVQSSLALLVTQLSPDDTIAIVTYAGDGGVLLDPTPVADAERIIRAIDGLVPGGGTNLEAGLRTGYRLASRAYREDAVNIVLLASDGVANIGRTGPDDIGTTVREQARDGISLVTVGYGMGNFNDLLMEQLANNGDGVYAYLDDYDEAEVFFRDQLVQLLVPVAAEAKVQVEFDPTTVAEYRLLGYENRAIADEDFRDDEVDAGELGSGHTAVALYQIRRVEGSDGPLGEVRLRWADPAGGDVTEIAEAIPGDTLAGDADDSLRLALTVGAFADLLAGHPAATERAVTFADLAVTAAELRDADPDDGRLETLVSMLELAATAQPYPAEPAD